MGSLNPYHQHHPHWPQGEGPGGEPGGVGDQHERTVLGLHARSYVLFVGTVEPRKGIDVLLAAHAALRRQGHPDLKLVVAGPPGWGETPALDGPGVVAPGRIDEATLDALYRGAAVLAVPSLSEGFGLPALEAMARGCPVVASKAGALPEVLGDTGVLVPPGDPDSLAAALDGILGDDSVAAAVGAAGHRRAGTFTWAACTSAHLAAYRAALGLPGPAPASGPAGGGGAVGGGPVGGDAVGGDAVGGGPVGGGPVGGDAVGGGPVGGGPVGGDAVGGDAVGSGDVGSGAGAGPTDGSGDPS